MHWWHPTSVGKFYLQLHLPPPPTWQPPSGHQRWGTGCQGLCHLALYNWKLKPSSGHHANLQIFYFSVLCFTLTGFLRWVQMCRSHALSYTCLWHFIMFCTYCNFILQYHGVNFKSPPVLQGREESSWFWNQMGLAFNPLSCRFWDLGQWQ